MKHMVGVGPIPMESIQHFAKTSKNDTEAMIKSVKEYLKYYLKFEDEEIQQMNFMDAKKAAKEDLIYFALEDQQDIREIYFRKAASGNDDLCVRDYIPPQYHSRYMAISRKATESRASDKTLKTQMRWGDKDVEIHVKTKGSEEPYRKVNLKDFMGDTPLPEFDSKVKWTQRKGNILRKTPIFGEESQLLPSLALGRQQKNGSRKELVRSHSNSSREEAAKRMRDDTTDMETQDDLNQYDEFDNVEEYEIEEEEL